MKTIQQTALMMLVLILLTGWSVKGQLLQENDPQFGANSLTYDSGTGLTWLGLTFSQGLSYSQALTAMQTGGQFDGFRFATADEVQSLFNSAGFGQGFITQSDPGYQEIGPLILMIGATSANEATGITGTLVNDGSELTTELSYITFNANEYYVDATFGNTQYGLNTSYNSVGNWIVAVPEPSTYALIFAGGVLSLLLSRRKMDGFFNN